MDIFTRKNFNNIHGGQVGRLSDLEWPKYFFTHAIFTWCNTFFWRIMLLFFYWKIYRLFSYESTLFVNTSLGGVKFPWFPLRNSSHEFQHSCFPLLLPSFFLFFWVFEVFPNWGNAFKSANFFYHLLMIFKKFLRIISGLHSYCCLIP